MNVAVVMFFGGLTLALAGALVGLGRRARRWDSRYFSVTRDAEEVRLSYGMGPIPQALMIFGVATFLASFVLLLLASRGRAVGLAADAIAMEMVFAVTVGGVSWARARRRSGIDDLVIEVSKKRLVIPAAARLRADRRVIDLEAIETLSVEMVDRDQGRFGHSLDGRVVAHLRGASEGVVVAAHLTEPAARGMAAELGRLLNEAHPRQPIVVEATPKRLKESQAAAS